MAGARRTIFASATGPGGAAITVVRLSGADSRMIVKTLCGALPAPRRASLRALRTADGEILDRGIVVWMPGPASYTGEDCAEFSVHGGPAILAALSTRLLALGACPAEAGEFTRRAFLAGKMDLLEAEAVADLVAADTEAQRVQALRAMEGGPARLVAAWADRLRTLLAFQEALIDFPEDDLPPETDDRAAAELRDLEHDMAAQADQALRAVRLREGVVIAIAGPPNVGKSSLVNALTGREIAIVSPSPGTTRDALEAHIVLAGVPATLIDTAGLRETEDPIEAEGIRRARARAASADLVLHLHDARTPGAPDPDARTLHVANKTDLARFVLPGGMLGISVLTGHGLDALRLALERRVTELASVGQGPVLSHARHAACLRDAAASFAHARAQTLPELRAEDIRLAMAALGRITGAIDAEAVLDTIFSRFCIGK